VKLADILAQNLGKLGDPYVDQLNFLKTRRNKLVNKPLMRAAVYIAMDVSAHATLVTDRQTDSLAVTLDEKKFSSINYSSK
jgi:hypothetical protein